LINFSNKLSSIILSFTITPAIGIISIIYIQAVHGSTTNLVNGSSLQYPERTATLIVIKNVSNPPINESESTTNDLRSLFTANDFIMHVNGNNPFPYEFPGSESGTSILIGAGSYAVTETKPSNPGIAEVVFSANYSKDCTGILKDGENKSCTITNTIHS